MGQASVAARAAPPSVQTGRAVSLPRSATASHLSRTSCECSRASSVGESPRQHVLNGAYSVKLMRAHRDGSYDRDFAANWRPTGHLYFGETGDFYFGTTIQAQPPPPPLLAKVRRHEHPFAFYDCTPALSLDDCRALERLFEGEQPWQHRSKGGYECAIRDATSEISAKLKTMLIREMRAITGIALMDRVQITVQQMEPGQHVGEHSDHPQLGYEFARLLLYLNNDWQPADGGVLELLDGPNGNATGIPPRYNHAFAFLLHADSLHRVSEVHRLRKSVVFNFWHPANSPALAAAIDELLAGKHLSELPEEMDAWVSPIECLLDEETSARANVAAIVLHRWGYDARVATAGYYACAGRSWRVESETIAAVRLAVWIATLHQGIFDLAGWRLLVDEVGDLKPPVALLPLWDMCLPKLIVPAEADRTCLAARVLRAELQS